MEIETRTKLPLITIILVIVNVVIFLLTDLFLVDLQDEAAYYMALNPFLVLKKGEYWRVVTSMFYHFGVDHLACNMLMLFLLGRMLEPVLGRVWYFLLYFVSGLVASGASILYNGIIVSDRERIVFSAGASGAVYGLVGAFAVLFFFQRDRVPVSERRRTVFALIVLLFGSIFDSGVGHDAHFGGFITGGVMGTMYYMWKQRKQQKQRDT